MTKSGTHLSVHSGTYDLMKNELRDGFNAGKLSHHYGHTL